VGIFVLDIHPTYPAWLFFDFTYPRKNRTKEKQIGVEHAPFLRFYLPPHTVCAFLRRKGRVVYLRLLLMFTLLSSCVKTDEAPAKYILQLQKAGDK